MGALCGVWACICGCGIDLLLEFSSRRGGEGEEIWDEGETRVGREKCGTSERGRVGEGEVAAG